MEHLVVWNVNRVQQDAALASLFLENLSQTFNYLLLVTFASFGKDFNWIVRKSDTLNARKISKPHSYLILVNLFTRSDKLKIEADVILNAL